MEHLPDIKIAVIPHHHQIYDTAGNYLETCAGWRVDITKLSDWRMEFALMMHELAEMAFTKHHGIPWNEITKFDIESGLDDPGACPKAPYHSEHLAAERIEKEIALLLGIKWEDYQKELDNLDYKGAENAVG